jgi:hypothetical protein
MIAYQVYQEAINVNSVYGCDEYNLAIPKKVYTLEIVDNKTIFYDFIMYICKKVLLFLIKVLIDFTIIIKKIINLIIFFILFQIFLITLKNIYIIIVNIYY